MFYHEVYASFGVVARGKGEFKMVWNDSAIEVTEEEFRSILNCSDDNSNKLVVVNFFAEWCMPCLMLSPVVEELAEKMNEVKFTKINIDDNSELSGKFRISSIPCLVVFRDGKEIDRITGAQTADIIEEKIKKILEGGESKKFAKSS
jgi:thioredoxin 1